jgi:hypothetical protein
MVEQMLLVHDQPEEAKKRADAAFEMVTNGLLWNEHINPRWVDIFDKIVADSHRSPIETSTDENTPVFKGEML